MEPISINTLFELLKDGGLAAAFAVAWWLERKERLESNKTVIETLRTVPASLAILDRATKIIEGLGK